MKIKKIKKKLIVGVVSLLVLVGISTSYQQKSGKLIETKTTDLNLIEKQKNTKKVEKKDTNIDLKKEEDVIVTEEKTTNEVEKTKDNNNSSNNSLATNTEETTNKSNSNNVNTDNSKKENTSSDISNNSPTVEQEVVNTKTYEYKIHKGRIDCNNESTCHEKGMPIYFQYKKAIKNLFYVEVVSNKNNRLGYFIEYVFKTSSFSTNDECQNYGTNIKNSLSDRVTGYTCILTDESYELNIETDYD